MFLNIRLFIAILLLAGLSHKSLANEDRYLLNAGDVLFVSVWNEEALQKQVVVLPDGSMSFPLAGEMIAEGKAISEVEEELVSRLSDYISNPVVNVSVVAVEGNSIHVLGKVQNPGSFVMRQNLRAMQALSLAGGLTPFASENNIIVLRQVNGEQQTLNVRYSDIKRGRALESNVLLQSGDVLVIP
ncbi:polysaccharide biosynthesis/export family protein [Methylophaga lonarensis]|uniref:polysaccharide biosynthesis/export family protein n=1 Tax=Methylophaga lonarensis TaxID=999151 RepID=UPI003D28502D